MPTPWELHLGRTVTFIYATISMVGSPKQFKGRMLRLRIRDDKVVKTTVVAKAWSIEWDSNSGITCMLLKAFD